MILYLLITTALVTAALGHPTQAIAAHIPWSYTVSASSGGSFVNITTTDPCSDLSSLCSSSRIQGLSVLLDCNVDPRTEVLTWSWFVPVTNRINTEQFVKYIISQINTSKSNRGGCELAPNPSSQSTVEDARELKKRQSSPAPGQPGGNFTPFRTGVKVIMGGITFVVNLVIPVGTPLAPSVLPSGSDLITSPSTIADIATDIANIGSSLAMVTDSVLAIPDFTVEASLQFFQIPALQTVPNVVEAELEGLVIDGLAQITSGANNALNGLQVILGVDGDTSGLAAAVFNFEFVQPLSTTGIIS